MNLAKLVFRKKVMVVPKTRDGKVLMTRDKKTNEWGFVTGGVKKNESFKMAAERELQEETSNFLCKIPNIFTRIETKTLHRPGELKIIDELRNETVISTYHIFIYNIDEIDISNFTSNEEVSEMKFDYFLDNENTWDICEEMYSKFIQYK